MTDSLLKGGTWTQKEISRVLMHREMATGRSSKGVAASKLRREALGPRLLTHCQGPLASRAVR